MRIVTSPLEFGIVQPIGQVLEAYAQLRAAAAFFFHLAVSSTHQTFSIRGASSPLVREYEQLRTQASLKLRELLLGGTSQRGGGLLILRCLKYLLRPSTCSPRDETPDKQVSQNLVSLEKEEVKRDPLYQFCR